VVKELGLVLKEDPQHAGDGEDHLVVQHIQKKCLPHPLASIILQSGQPLPGILDFGEGGVSAFPELEDALILPQDFLVLLPLFSAQFDIPIHYSSSSVTTG
jgi:hypothetical protein